MAIPFEQLRFKQLRFGPMLVEASKDPAFFDQVHVIFGGTGAVGGSTALRILSFYDQACRYGQRPEGNTFHLGVTGLRQSDIHDFTLRLRQTHKRRIGKEIEVLGEGRFRTANNAVLHMEQFSVEPSLPELKLMHTEGLEVATDHFLKRFGLSKGDASREALIAAIRDQDKGAFTQYLEGFRERFLADTPRPFSSVSVSIPLPSVATYHTQDMVHFAKALGIQSADDIDAIKDTFLEAFPEDLAYVTEHLADEVVVAHTTAVGGMYDEDHDGTRHIRLGFAHSALGDKLREKQRHAESMTKLYSERDIKMLVTAAAIGVDEILHNANTPLMPAIYHGLREATAKGHAVVPKEDLDTRLVHVYKPFSVNVFEPADGTLAASDGVPLECDTIIRSGENGYFSVGNADALYRVMRVASDAELGFVMARTAVFGNYRANPQFRDNICYYTETDYSRQVFDLLEQPSLRADQLSGLQPKALQFLGSSKHQGEMHTIGLLILLHRLQTLDLSGVRSRGSLETFDAEHYFETHTRALTYDDVVSWDVNALADKLQTLITAREVTDLARFVPVRHLHQRREQAVHRILELVLRAVWAIPSLGTPILYERNGETRALIGPYAAPIDKVLTHRRSILDAFRESFETKPGPRDRSEFLRFCEFHFANGFVDLRPTATLVATRHAQTELAGKVTRFENQPDFIAALEQLTPFSYFTSSGLIALLVRFKGLARWADELDLSIGTANDFRSHFKHDPSGQVPVYPGLVEAFRMVSEGQEKNTGCEPLDGHWGYGWPAPAFSE